MMYEPIAGARTSETPGLEDYLKAIRERWWVVVAMAVIGLALATLYGNSRTATYDATARVVVGPTPVGATSPGQDAVPVLEREQEKLKSIGIAKEVQEELGLTGTPDELLEGLSVQFAPESDTMRVTYNSTDPELARDIVNAFANAYVTQREQAAVNYYAEQTEIYQAELDAVLEERSTAEERIAQLEAERADVIALPDTNPTKQPRLNAIENELGSLRNLVSRTLDTENTITRDMSALQRRAAARVPAAEVLEEARTPSSPTGIGTRIIQVAGFIVGGMLGIATAFVLDRLDKTARDTGDVELALGTQVLSSVPPLGFGNRSGGASLVMLSDKRSASAQRARESYRRLRSSVQFLATSNGTKSFVITSYSPGEGKSTTAANLALALAQSGASTVLIGADMRRPTVSKLFGLSNAAGLSQWLAGDDNVDLELKLSTVPNLSVVPAGPTPENAGELLASQRFESLIRHFEQSHEYVIIDTPPVNSTADASTIAAHAGGVITVVDSRRTDTNSLLQVRADVTRAGGNVVGAVLNRDRKQRGGFLRSRYGYYEKAGARI